MEEEISQNENERKLTYKKIFQPVVTGKEFKIYLISKFKL